MKSEKLRVLCGCFRVPRFFYFWGLGVGLNLTINTVYKHFQNIYNKLEVDTKALLISCAMDNGFIRNVTKKEVHYMGKMILNPQIIEENLLKKKILPKPRAVHPK